MTRFRGVIARRLMRLPGGAFVLGMLRRAVRTGRVLARSTRHPTAAARERRRTAGWAWNELDVRVLATRVDEDRPFLNTNRLAGRCRYVYRQGGSFIVHDDVDNDWYFCKTEDVGEFFADHAPGNEFILFTGHGDTPVYGRHRRYLKRPELKAWFATNVLIDHPKLFARPYGTDVTMTPHDTSILRNLQERNLPKRDLFHCQFVIENNPFERRYCLEQTGLTLGPWVPWPQFIEDLAASYFCISPNGMGIDCKRTWEALLLRTIPVVRRSRVTEQHRDYPMIVLDDWSQFRSIDFSPELYERTWGNWDPDELLLDRYLQRVERLLGST